MVSLDLGVRTEAIPLLGLRSEILDVLHPEPSGNEPSKLAAAGQGLCKLKDDSMVSVDTLDYVPPGMPEPSSRAQCFIFEDNDAILKMVRGCRSNQMRHKARTHRVKLDFRFELCNSDPSLKPRYVHASYQLVDIFTKGSLTAATWRNLVALCRVGLPHGSMSKNSSAETAPTAKLQFSVATCPATAMHVPGAVEYVASAPNSRSMSPQVMTIRGI